MIEKPYESAHDIFNISSVVILPIIAEAMILEGMYGACLQPEPQGVYKLGETKQVFNPNENYYKGKLDSKNQLQLTPITDFSSTTDHICNRHGHIVINAFMMRNQERYLSSYPSLPTRSIVIIENVLKNHLSGICEHPDARRNFNAKIYENILPSYHFLLDDGKIEDICAELCRKVTSFVGYDTWHLYKSSRTNGDVSIEKFIDYRIMDYHRRIDEEYQNKIDEANGDRFSH